MNTRWSSHLKGDEAKKFAEYVSNCNTILERLTDIVNQQCQALECPSQLDYDSPSWAHKQADRIGQLRAYREILKLTDLTL